MPGHNAPEEEQQKLKDAITETADGVLVTKFLVIAETIDSEGGEKQLELMYSDEMAAWDRAGFLRYALSVFDAQRVLIEADEQGREI